MNFKKWLSVFLAFLFIFSFSLSTNAATTQKGLEKLVKTAETSAISVGKQMSATSLKQINIKSIQTLTTNIDKAKSSMKGYKGKDKANFDKRMKSLDQSLSQAKIYNGTLAKAMQLEKELAAFQKAYKADPFQTEKRFNDIMKKNQQLSTEINKLSSKSIKSAVSKKYQAPVQKVISTKNEFFKLNKQISSFITFTNKNDEFAVWEEFFGIWGKINEAKLSENEINLLADKWLDTYYPKFVAADEKALTTLFQEYFHAMNNRDASKMADLYHLTGDERKAYIEILEAAFKNMPTLKPVEIITFDLQFVYQDEAFGYATIKENSEEEIEVYFQKVDGNWVIVQE